MSKILVIEDEEKLAHFIELELQYEGYVVTVCKNGLNTLTVAKEIKPDLVLIDLMLGNISGLDICRHLRSIGDKVPVILLTNKDEINDRVAGLDAGADDYLLKPFSGEELVTRIRVHLRNLADQEDPDLLEFIDLTLNKRTREVYRGDRQIELTSTEYYLLEYLISHPREVLTREEILEKVWGYDFRGDSNIIEVYIRYLRIKLEANHESRLIKTVRGIGYVLKE